MQSRQPGLCSQFKSRLDYAARPCYKTNRLRHPATHSHPHRQDGKGWVLLYLPVALFTAAIVPEDRATPLRELGPPG